MINWQIQKEVKKFFNNIENKKILDFGCGDGRYKKFISKTNDYTGIDVEESGHLNTAKKYDIIWNKKKLPFENDYFDAILMTEVLEHIEDIDTTLKEIYRVLKKNGSILITVPFMWKEHEKPYDFQRFTSFGLKKLFQKNGFEIINQKKLVEKKMAIMELFESEFNKQTKLNSENKIIYFFS